MIFRFSQQLGHSLARQLDKPKQAAIFAYGFELLLSMLWELTALLILAGLLGVFKITVLLILSSTLLRIVSGGFHSASFQRCFYLTVGTYLLLALGVSKTIEYITWQHMQFVFCFSLIALTLIILRWVPTKNPHKSFDIKQSRKFKILSLGVLYFWSLYYITVQILYPPLSQPVNNAFILLIGLMWQGLQLTPWGFSFFEKLDALLKKFQVKGGEVNEKS